MNKSLGFVSIKGQQRGFFIGIILLISFLVLALSVSMHHQLGSVSKGVKQNEEQLQLEWVARSGLEATVARLREDNGLDGPQPRLEVPDIPGATYESEIFNNLMGSKDARNPEAPGALSPDGKAWVSNGSAYIQVTAFLNEGDDESSAVAGASATVGYGSQRFDVALLADKKLKMEQAYLSFYDGKSWGTHNGEKSLSLLLSSAGSQEVVEREMAVARTNNMLALERATTVCASGRLEVFEETMNQVDFYSGSMVAATSGSTSENYLFSTRARDFIPKTTGLTGLSDGSLYVAGNDFEIRTLYPASTGGFELQEGTLRLSGGIYEIEGDVVLKDLVLENFGNPDEPTTLIVNGNIAFDGVQVNSYGSHQRSGADADYGADRISDPGEPTALKILVRNNHHVAIRDSNVAAIICVAEGSLFAVNSNLFGFAAASEVELDNTTFFAPLNDFGKNISVFGEIELYEIHENFIAEGSSGGSNPKGRDVLAENHGFAPEPPMPTIGQDVLDSPVEGLSSNPDKPADLGGEKWDFPAENETISAPADGVVAPGDDRVSGVAVTVYDPPPGAVPSCFPAGVLVMTPEGKKAIETLQVGDAVLTYSDKLPVALSQSLNSSASLGSVQEVSVIEKVFVHPDSRIGTIRLERLSDGRETDLEVTAEHVVYSHYFKDWRPIGHLPLGSMMQSPAGPLRIVSEWRFSREGTTYNFELAEHHTYCVGELGAWVHNYKEPVFPPPPPPPAPVATVGTGGGTGGSTGGGTGMPVGVGAPGTGGAGVGTVAPPSTENTVQSGGGGGGNNDWGLGTGSTGVFNGGVD